MSILFCRVAWMEKYQGNISVDKPYGGGAYIEENGYGSEIHNFSVSELPIEECVFELSAKEKKQKSILICQGYVRMQNGNQIKIENLGASKEDKYINGVTVVWVAKRPFEKNQCIVGWYRNATVYRLPKEPYEDSLAYYDGCYCNTEARASDCLLLPSSKRHFIIPKASSKYSIGMGQSNVWFATGEKNSQLVKNVIGYINDYCDENI